MSLEHVASVVYAGLEGLLTARFGATPGVGVLLWLVHPDPGLTHAILPDPQGCWDPIRPPAERGAQFLEAGPWRQGLESLVPRSAETDGFESRTSVLAWCGRQRAASESWPSVAWIRWERDGTHLQAMYFAKDGTWQRPEPGGASSIVWALGLRHQRVEYVPCEDGSDARLAVMFYAGLEFVSSPSWMATLPWLSLATSRHWARSLLGASRAAPPPIPPAAPPPAARTKPAMESLDGFGLVGSSPAMREVRELIAKLGKVSAPVLVTGETGTGKELVAQALHRAGPRRDKPFVEVNCSAFPPSLVESELFGHEKGAFTDARTTKHGIFERARDGSVFLDEVGDMPLEIQAKFLRVLEEKRFSRLSGAEVLAFDGRIVAATNRSLKEDVETGRFRRDLLYRLDVGQIELPPLRSRPGDIPALARHFVMKACREEMPERLLPRLSDAAIQQLQAHVWPGNVRELKNVITRAVVLSGEELVLGPEHLYILTPGRTEAPPPARPPGSTPSKDELRACIQRGEGIVARILRELQKAGWPASRKVLMRWIEEQGLEADLEASQADRQRRS